MLKTIMIFIIIFGINNMVSAWDNIYICQDMRTYIKNLQTFTADVDAASVPFAPEVSVTSIRAYGLQSERMLCLYLVNVGDQAAGASGQTVTVDPPFSSGQGYWYDPASGDTVSTFSVTESGALQIPDFFVDVAAKIKSDSVIAIQRPPAATQAVSVSVYPNPASSGALLSIRFDFNSRPGNTELSIYNIKGRLIKRFSSQTLWQVPDTMPNGIYLLRTVCNGRMYAEKIVIHR